MPRLHRRRGAIQGPSWTYAVIAPALRRTARRARHQQRQRKSNSTCDQQRAERIFLHGFRHRLLAAANGVAAVFIGVLGIIDGGIGGVAGGILGLAVEILHRAGGFARAALGLRLRIASHVADSAFDLTGKILGRAGNPILVHRGLSCFHEDANRRDPFGFLKRSKCLGSERLDLRRLGSKYKPAIDHDGLADDVGRKRRGQEQRRAGHVGGRAEPLQRDPLQRAFEALRI